MKFKIMMALAFVCGVSRVDAYEIDPEYRSMPSQRGFTLIDAYPVDSEYQSDLLTYQISPRDARNIARVRFGDKPVQGHLLFSAGSLSATQFDQKLRAEILAPLSASTRVRFLRTEDENHEEDSSHSIIELEQRVSRLPDAGADTRGLFVAVYGEVSRLKKEDDVGVALSQRTKSSETRVFLTQVDFTRSERNDNADRFESGYAPLAFGIVHRAVDENGFSEVFFRRESAVRWNNPTNAQTFLYENRVAGGTWLLESNESSHSIRAQWDSKHTALESMPLGVVSKRRERLEIEGRRSDYLSDQWTFEAGMQWVQRTWTDEADRKLIHENLLPFVWLTHESGVEAGLETTLFHRWGDSSLGSPNTRVSAEESRLNLRYRVHLQNNAEFRAALTFDIDGAAGGLFEGGHGQFAINF